MQEKHSKESQLSGNNMDLNTDGRDVQPQISNDHSNDIQESNLPNPIKIPKIDAEQKEEVSTSTTSNPK